MPSAYDVLVLGGGVAGLAAARACHDAGARVLLLEARERLGGRILTHREAGFGPIELGAEFVHGEAAELQPHLAAGGLRVMDVAGRRWRASPRGLRPDDHFWEALRRVMRHLDEHMDPDRSFARFLADQPGGRRNAEARRAAAHFVEGFQAADLRVVSARSLAGEGNPTESSEAQRLGRIIEGYDRLVAVLAEPIARRVRLRTTVTGVRWSRGRVQVGASAEGRRTRTFTARGVVVTVPLGVLKSRPGATGHIRFDPTIGQLAAPLAGLAVGHVTRVVLRCREPFWTRARCVASARQQSLSTLSFVHAPDEPFPVFWTQYPDRTPTLVAWCGGPRALRYSGLPEAALRTHLWASLGRVFGVAPRSIGARVLGLWRRDWDRDPFSRGAYSYAAVGGADAWGLLARPVENTLFFAGEATVTDGRIGTVDGAIASGERAARQLLRAWRTSSPP